MRIEEIPPMTRILSTLALSAALLLGGCQNPDGSTNWGNTLLLGAGIGAAAGLVAGAASDRPDRRYAQGYGNQGYGNRDYGNRGYWPGGYGQGYGRGHGRGYRGW
jgi:hypothetical protein